MVSVTKTYEFAGEEVKVTETVTADSSGKTKEQNTSKPSIGETKKRQVLPEIKWRILLCEMILLFVWYFCSVKRSGGGLGNVLQQMQKKPKISTLVGWVGPKY